MPELPEVETIKQGITPHIINETIQEIVLRRSNLRWPIPANIRKDAVGQTIKSIERRGKYLLVQLTHGCIIIHLGMSGRLHIVEHDVPYKTHDHVDFIFKKHRLRYNDPRRFGAILWADKDPLDHPLLIHLGIEPLSDEFNGDYLYAQTRQLSAPIKTTLMNHKIVVGVGNIYAAESLFLANIHPQWVSKKLDKAQCKKLVKTIKKILNAAIDAGGTTLKDFLNGDGKPGYFQQDLKVYGRDGQPCLQCHTMLQKIILQQRATVFCPACQHL